MKQPQSIAAGRSGSKMYTVWLNPHDRELLARMQALLGGVPIAVILRLAVGHLWSELGTRSAVEFGVTRNGETVSETES